MTANINITVTYKVKMTFKIINIIVLYEKLTYNYITTSQMKITSNIKHYSYVPIGNDF